MEDRIELRSPLWTVFLLGAMLLFGWFSWQLARVAGSRLLAKYGTIVADEESLSAAETLAPQDAETHFDRAAMFKYVNQPESAIKEFEMAVALRPHDYL